MATVHFGRLLGPVGFSRTVAIKRLHPQYAVDPEFVSMFLDEARLAARIRHPNVVSTLDVVALEGELMLVMEYVQGESLSRLLHAMRTRKERVPLRIAVAAMIGILAGLHAAHEAKSERGEPLGLVHRDMSPQNVLIGVDGAARVLDFGIAKATGRVQTTRDGQFKGKLAYVAPEQLRGDQVDRRCDIYSASVIFWEILTLGRLFKGESEWDVMNKVLTGQIIPASKLVPDLPPALDELVMRGLSNDPSLRFSSAREMAIALEQLVPHASTREVADWAELVAGDSLRRRAQQVEEIETASHTLMIDSGVRDLSGLMARLPTNPPAEAGSGPSSRPMPRPSIPTPGMASLPIEPVVASSSAPQSFPAMHEPPPQRSRALPVVLFLLLIVGVGSVLLFVRLRDDGTGSPSREKSDLKAAASTKAESTGKAEPAPKAEGDDKGEVTVVATATAADSASAPTAPTNKPWPKFTGAISPKIAPAVSAKTSAPVATETVAAPPVPTETATAAPAAKCNPPFTIDAQGIRHPKPECL